LGDGVEHRLILNEEGRKAFLNEECRKAGGAGGRSGSLGLVYGFGIRVHEFVGQSSRSMVLHDIATEVFDGRRLPAALTEQPSEKATEECCRPYHDTRVIITTRANQAEKKAK
jgi:hypothetical protein